MHNDRVVVCHIMRAFDTKRGRGGGGGRRPGSGDGFSEQEFVLLFQNKNTKFYICILYAGQPGFPNVGNACK